MNDVDAIDADTELESKPADRRPPGALANHEALPEFDLECLVDDRGDPTLVMLVPATDLLGAADQWITIDADHAVPLDEIR